MLKSFLTAAAIAALMSAAACGPSTDSAEKAGEAADTAYEQATTGETNLGDGPAENAGEAVDEATENATTDGAVEAPPASPPATTP
jgi:ABC-type phosphate/phosphonate transport system substrate-binding protein